MILVEYPRSGGTWLLYLLSYYLNIPLQDADTGMARNSLLWYVEKGLFGSNGYALSVPPALGRVVYKNHEFPDTRNVIFHKDRFILYLVRDVRDIMISYYFYKCRFLKKSARLGKFRKIIPDFFDNKYIRHFSLLRFLKDNVPMWKCHVESWIDHKDVRLVIKYEDLLSSPVSEMERVLSVFKVPIDQERLEFTVRKFSFENLSNGRKRGEDKNDGFWRKGIVGDHKNYFDDRHLEFINQECDLLLQRLGYL